jgi:hypothetical protein
MADINSHQVGGDHYASKAVQPWDAMEAWMTKEAFAGYLHGNCIKYLARYLDKNGVQDLKKCQHYLAKLIEIEDGKKIIDDTAKKDDGKVGYRKPPIHSRFKAGQSGNPKGRPKGKSSAAKLIEFESAWKIMAENILQFQSGREAAINGFKRDERRSKDWLEGYDQVRAETND